MNRTGYGSAIPCPVSAGRIEQMYFEDRRSLRELTDAINAAFFTPETAVSKNTVARWMDAMGIARRTKSAGSRLWERQHPEEKKAQTAPARAGWIKGVAEGAFKPGRPGVVWTKAQRRAALRTRAAKSDATVTLECAECGVSFERKRHRLQPGQLEGTAPAFCGIRCQTKHIAPRRDFSVWRTKPCDQCGKMLARPQSGFKGATCFCDQQCALLYRRRDKQTETRESADRQNKTGSAQENRLDGFSVKAAIGENLSPPILQTLALCVNHKTAAVCVNAASESGTVVPRELAIRLGVCKDTVMAACADGRVKATYVGGYWRIAEEEALRVEAAGAEAIRKSVRHGGCPVSGGRLREMYDVEMQSLAMMSQSLARHTPGGRAPSVATVMRWMDAAGIARRDLSAALRVAARQGRNRLVERARASNRKIVSGERPEWRKGEALRREDSMRKADRARKKTYSSREKLARAGKGDHPYVACRCSNLLCDKKFARKVYELRGERAYCSRSCAAKDLGRRRRK